MIPQTLNGKNIGDYFDTNVDAKFAALELEEEQLRREIATNDMESNVE